MKSLLIHWDDAEVFAGSKVKKRLLKQWTHTAKAFGVYHLIIVGNEIPQLFDAEIAIDIYPSYDEARKTTSGQHIVLIEGGGDISQKIKLEKTTVFVVGSNYSDPEVREGDTTISIQANIPLWDVVAVGIVLHKAMKWH